MSIRHTSVNKKLDNSVESTADAEEEHLPFLMEAIKQRISWESVHVTLKACGHLLDIIVPQIVRQLRGRSGAVLIYVFDLSSSLNIAKGESVSRAKIQESRAITYGCLGDMFWNVDVDHGVAFA